MSRWLLLFSLVCFVISGANGATPEKKKRWYCSRAVLTAAGLTVALTVAPGIVHSTSSYITGKDHIGHGIYMDMDRVMGKLSAEDRLLVESDKTPTQLKIQIFTTRLEGNYGNWMFSPVALPSRASDYLDPRNHDRGVCRQKACVLHSILDHLGIESNLQSGSLQETPYRWHVWVYVPELDMVADPTTGKMTPANEYYRGYSVIMDGVPLPSGWY